MAASYWLGPAPGAPRASCFHPAVTPAEGSSRRSAGDPRTRGSILNRTAMPRIARRHSQLSATCVAPRPSSQRDLQQCVMISCQLPMRSICQFRLQTVFQPTRPRTVLSRTCLIGLLTAGRILFCREHLSIPDRPGRHGRDETGESCPAVVSSAGGGLGQRARPSIDMMI